MKLFNFNPKKQQPSDQEVVTGIKNHANGVVDGFYKRCRERYDDSKTISANTDYDERQEIFQSAFIALWEKIEYGDIYVEDGHVLSKRKKKKTGEIVISKVNDLVSFFMGIAFNKLMELLRHRGKEVPAEIIPDNSDDDDDMEIFSCQMAIVDTAIKQMPHHCREILSMFYIEGMSLEEILEKRKESSSYNGLKNGKAKCMKKLRDYIHEKRAA